MLETTSRAVRVLALLIAAVGAIDAARGEHWDQLGMLVAIAVLLVVDLGIRRFVPPTVAVRPDLIEWLRDEAAHTDDEPGLVADRALAAYRAATRPEPGALPPS